MHAEEIVVSIDLAGRLVADQFPDWTGLELRSVGAGGSDNVMIRLGAGLVLRFPRLASAVGALETELRWLGWAAGVSPLAVPEVVAEGRPGCGYPFPWAVLRWMPGQDAQMAPPGDDLAAARALAGFVAALREQAVPAGMPEKRQPLQSRDAFTREMIGRMTDEADPGAVTRLWEAALALPEWAGVPVPVHADLHPLNLLTREGALAAVIDWGGFGAGDPALDLICGWTVLGDRGRALFRQLLAVDEATWARGRAYAFSKAVMAAPYYRQTNPALHAVMLRTLRRSMADWPE